MADARADLHRTPAGLRDIAGRVGQGGLAAAEGANAVSRLKAIAPGTALELRVLHGLDQLFHRLDTRVADVVEEGIRCNAYVARASAQRLADDASRMIVSSAERFVPLAGADLTVVGLVRTRLRPPAENQPPPGGAERSRADLHAAIVHHPERRERRLGL